MATYRGVEKSELVRSLRAAKKLLDNLDLGPQTEEWFSDWKRGYPFNEINQATQSRELAAVMRKTSARHALLSFQEIFIFHAAASLADGIDDGTPQLYRDLCAWGAFQAHFRPKPEIPGHEVRPEVDTYLTIAGFDRLHKMKESHGADSPPVLQAAERRAQYLEKLREKNKNLMRLTQELANVCAFLVENDHSREINNFLRDHPTSARMHLISMLYDMGDLSAHRPVIMSAPEPLQLYGVSLDYRTKLEKKEELTEKLRAEVWEIMTPYYRLDEAIPAHKTQVVKQAVPDTLFYFHSTRRVAQVIANRARNLNINQYTGIEKPMRIVPPQSPPSSPLPSPG